MQHPFQCVAALAPPSARSGDGGFLLAACGSRLLAISLVHAGISSQWSAHDSDDRSTRPASNGGEADRERPAKKLRTAPSNSTSPNIINLTVSPDHEHVVVVTDDKCVRVFSAQADGQLVELSQRFMPKRPCAVRILPDSATILCGDKFGDVYSLPLLQDHLDGNGDTPGADETSFAPEPAKLFKPAATDLTVHTQRNRRALEAQRNQKNLKAKTKEPLKFEHKFLLGHVSMLTDLVYATREVDGRSRTYIITTDRDEHIRVSRGPPQTHVIEGYCLGHTEFVSKVCLVPGTDLLVSGGGDDWLAIWEWPSYQMVRKFVRFRRAMRAARLDSHGSDLEDDPVAVSGMWIAPIEVSGSMQTAVVVACEKIPALAFLPVSELLKDDSEPVNFPVRGFEHPILDITYAGDTTLVSFDTRKGGQKRVQAFKFTIDQENPAGPVISLPVTQLDSPLSELNDYAGSDTVDDATLDQLLYGVANLRKRAAYGEVEDEGET